MFQEIEILITVDDTIDEGFEKRGTFIYTKDGESIYIPN